MARISHIQNALTAGELSPRLLGRTDLAKYNSGLDLCQNMVLMPHGGATRRSGTRFVAAAKYSDKDVRLVSFEFSTQQAYVLEFGDGYMRVFKDGAQVLTGVGGLPYEIVTPYAEADLPLLKFAQSADTLFLVHPSYAPRLLTRTGHAAWTLSTLETVDGPYLDENTDQAKTIAPSATGQYVKNGTFENSSENWTDKSSGTNAKILWDNGNYLDLIGVTGGQGYAEQTVTLDAANVEYTLEFEIKAGPITVRIGTATGGSQILADVSYDKGVQTVKFTPTVTTIYLGFLHTANASRAIDNVSISRQVSMTLTANFDLFQATHVGALVRLKHGAYLGYCRITAVADLRHATATVLDPLASTAPTYTWREGAWSDYQGWPGTVVFHQQRLCFGNTTRSPQTVWMSRSGKYSDFTPGAAADDPVTLTMASNQVNAIAWLVSAKSLVVGTQGSEWRIGSAESETPLQPATASAKEETTFGSAMALPVSKAGNVTLFIQRGGRKVRELVYDFQSGGWLAPDLSLLAEHITVGGLVDAAYAQDPDSILWAVRGDGLLVGLTYNRSEQVVGWHRHVTDGLFKRVATIRSGEIDQVWVVVERTVGGLPVRLIEYIADPFVDQPREESVFLDSHLTYSGPGASTFAGLDHLEGLTVDVLADGSVESSHVVTGGSITIDRTVTTACIGLPSEALLHTLPIGEGGAEDGTSQGHTKRVSKATVRVHRSLGYEVGPSLDKMERPPHRSTATHMGQAPDLFTGDDPVFIEGRYEAEGDIWIRQTQPYPLTVLAIITQVAVNG